jgi:hypothetical protein
MLVVDGRFGISTIKYDLENMLLYCHINIAIAPIQKFETNKILGQ